MGSRLVLACAAVALIAAPGSADIGLPQVWSQFHANEAHTGFNWRERTLTRASVHKLHRAWSVQTGAAIDGSVAVGRVGNGLPLLYVGSDDNVLHAYRPDGSEAWSRTLQSDSKLVASPAFAVDTVLAYNSSSLVTAFDAVTGAKRWSRSISFVQGAFPGSPTTAGGLVYAVPSELVALDWPNGSVRWTHPNIGCFLCSPAVSHGTLFIGGSGAVGQKLLALDAATGAERWFFRPHAGKHFGWSASPAVSGGRVFQPAFVQKGGKKAYFLYAFAASSGKRLWRARVGKSDFLTSSSPAVAYGLVFYVSPGGRVYALRAASGKTVWSKAIAPSASSPAVAGGVVYFGAGITMYGLDARNGKTLWHARTTSDPSDPAVFGGALYVGSGDGTLYAYRLPAG